MVTVLVIAVERGSIVIRRGDETQVLPHDDEGVRRATAALRSASAVADDSSYAALVQQAKGYAEAHIADVELDRAGIARHCSVSVRTLERAFSAAGLTVNGWVRDRRLEGLREDLIAPGRRAEPVSRVGAAWGLLDASQLSRSFKERFGLSPRSYRQVNSFVPSGMVSTPFSS
jgi:AraC-like DNA-binding protein